MMKSPNFLQRRTTDTPLYRLALYLIVLVAALTVGSFAVLGALAFPKHKTIQYFNQPFPVAKTGYRAGEHVSFTVKLHKYANTQTAFTRQEFCTDTTGKKYTDLLDSAIAANMPTDPNIDYETYQVTTGGVIPSTVPVGSTCHIAITSIYTFNVLNIVSVVATTDDYKIIK